MGCLIYVIAGGWLTALDAASGAVAWGPAAQGGLRATPNLAYDNGQVFAISEDSIVQAYNARTGTPTWSTVLPRERFVRTPPTAANGTLYVTGSGVGSTLFAQEQSTITRSMI